MNLVYRHINKDEFDNALKLVKDVFMEFEAPDYTQEGVDTFLNFISSDDFKNRFIKDKNLFLGCFDESKIVGLVGMKNESHVCLAFVDRNYHRKGIATQLFKLLFEDRKLLEISEITLNSSPYAVPFYHAIGFTDTEIQQTMDGITYTPMMYKIN